jgi:hypothetical protein
VPGRSGPADSIARRGIAGSTSSTTPARGRRLVDSLVVLDATANHYLNHISPTKILRVGRPGVATKGADTGAWTTEAAPFDVRERVADGSVAVHRQRSGGYLSSRGSPELLDRCPGVSAFPGHAHGIQGFRRDADKAPVEVVKRPRSPRSPRAEECAWAGGFALSAVESARNAGDQADR